MDIEIQGNSYIKVITNKNKWERSTKETLKHKGIKYFNSPISQSIK